MIAVINFKKFNSDKSLDELRYNVSIWSNDLAFISDELSFMRKLIESYPFVNNISNLFERIQLFIKEIDFLKNDKMSDPLKSIQKHETQLGGKFESTDLSCDNYYLIEHEKIAHKVFDYVRNYRNFKRGLEEYMSSHMN